MHCTALQQVLECCLESTKTAKTSLSFNSREKRDKQLFARIQHYLNLTYIMSGFMANLFQTASSPSKHENILPVPTPPPALHARSAHNEAFRPQTPTRNSFITPVSTPQGSPSKNKNPPGAIDLPSAFDHAMKLAPGMGSPSKIGRLQATGTPLSLGKSNAFMNDESYFSSSPTTNVDESVLHKSAIPGSPLRKQGKENTPPGSRSGLEGPQTPATASRQEVYLPRDQSQATVRKYNTQRGLTNEELEILQKPNVKRLANVTQLCK